MIWIKALHVFFVIAWFAGIFYLPRIFVNLAMVDDDKVYDHLLVMARKLYKFTNLISVFAIVLGIVLIVFNPSYYLSQAWMHAKLTLVVLIIGYFHVCGAYLKKFEKRSNSKGHVFYRWFNEAPVIVLLLICLFVIAKPF